MFKKCLFIILIGGLLPSLVLANGVTIKGKVTDKETGQPLVGANVFLKGTSFGSSTNIRGEYVIKNVTTGNYTLVVSYIGYAQVERSISVDSATEMRLDVALERTELISEQVVVTASRVLEKITDAPATINVISAREIEELPSANLGELLSYQKGVDYVRTGIVGTGINIRGFNSAFNAKNLQMNDNRLSTLVATSLPLGALSTTVKEDIERIEVILGPNAALYGPNAHNGLVNTITKDPRTSEGTTFVVNGGNHESFSGRFRHADVVNEKFRYKITGEYTRGKEIDFVDSVYVAGKGYPEIGLDRNFDSIRGEASFYFSPRPDADFILTAGGSNSNNLGVTNAGRNQIVDWRIFFLQARYVSKRLFAQVYHTWSITDDTYALNQRTQNYLSFIAAGFPEEEALRRSLHEAWFGSSPDNGFPLNREANFKDDSRRWNAEIQYNNTWAGFEVVGGIQWQRDIANSKGTYLLDQDGPIQLDQVGFYAQVEKALGESGVKLIAAARGDNHELYGFNFIPKGGLLYSHGSSTWRLTYGKGIAAPTILNLSANIFGGLLLGNGEGFTLTDGTKIPKLEVEKIQTIEAGYKGIVSEKLYIDTNAYINFHKDFISPLINIANPAAGNFVTHRGDKRISEIIPGTPDTGVPFLLTYLNFGEVTTFGFDVGLNYFINNNFNVRLNYSFFDFDLDTSDPKNDGNRDGKVNENDLPINTPKHKLSLFFNANKDKWFGNVGIRWVDEYDFFSGINVAAKTNPDLIYNGDPVIEGRRVGRDFNEGPLGGFVNVDVSLGYRITHNFSLGARIVNLFNTEVREFVASPSIGRLFSAEAKYTIF
ncbi:MAG: TonB-dependent receptor [Calditrichaeota bacterium]|nr:MAG: TonB-dependent receptor [Calditrichota bacterium]